MIIFPAIDLKAGQVVRLAEGDMDRATIYGDDPAEQARSFAAAGATHLHVVAAFPGRVQLGGGIRNAQAVEGWLQLGVARIVMGTAALKDPQFVREMAKAYPGQIVVAVDARDGMVATDGWANVSDQTIEDMAHRFEDAGVAALLFTDIGRDGLLTGCNVDATVKLARSTALPVIASGGVNGIQDIHRLAEHEADGIEGVITGRALYDGRLDLAEALSVAVAA
jgi:phosphoribosylformimino-5-aminoimidazole carboxamide ribotide isomerase